MKNTKPTHIDQQFFDERGFGLRMGFGERPAVLVIDFMKGFTHADMPLGSNLDKEVEETNRIINVAHKYDIPVIFTVVYYEEEDMTDAGIWKLKQKGVLTLKAGTEAVELDERLHREARGIVLLKKFASCFYGSDLGTRLTFRHVDTLIMTGCTTSGCVRATAVDACQHGYRAIVAQEAVGDRSETAHDQSLFDLHAKYADVMSVDGIIDHLETEYARKYNKLSDQ